MKVSVKDLIAAGMAAIVVTIPTSFAQETVPSWAKDATKLTGGIYTTACSGRAPSVDLARTNALNNCKLSVAAALSKSFATSTIAIQTESDAALHEEISTNEKFENLSCAPLKDEIFESAGSYEIWELCSFNLRDVKVAEDIKTTKVGADIAEQKDKSEIPNVVHSENRSLTLIVMPPCQSIMVVSKNPRLVKCQNPTTVVVEPSDTQLIIRGDSNHLPKKIDLNGKDSYDATVQVVLDSI